MRLDSEPLVSVFTPFHNSEDTLAESIESVLGQSYANFEYVLADNCSSDGSLAIAEHYAKVDARVRVLRYREFIGQLANYNRAIREMSAESRYCKIVQADDWIFPECLTAMVSVGEENPTVGIVSAFAIEGERIKNTGLPYPARCVPGADICRRQLLSVDFFFGSQTSILYRAEVVRSRQKLFDEDTLHADTELCYEVLKTWDFGFVHQVLTFMRVRNEGVSAAQRSFNPSLLDRYIVLNRFGSHFLTPGAFQDRRADVQRDYYAYLGLSYLRRREPEFWEHHRQGLASIGEPLDSINLPFWAARVVAKKPLSAVRRLLRDAGMSS
jgi:glycosyltransferase involved in cell wall biosynthesis